MRNSEEGKFDIRKNKDLIIILTMILMGFAGLLIFFVFGKNAKSVEVSVDGTVIERFSLYEDKTVEITGYGGNKNLLVIEKGSVYIKEATCPDGLCMKMGHIRFGGQSIVCLPARVVVSISDSDSKLEVDGISGGMILE